MNTLAPPCTSPQTPAASPLIGATSRFRRATSLHIGRDNLINLVEIVLEPAILTLSVWLIAIAEEGEISLPYMIVSLMAFALTFPAYPRLQESFARGVLGLLGGWLTLTALLLFFGYATRSLSLFPQHAINSWLLATPLALIGGHALFRLAAPWLLKAQGSQRAVIVGMNEQGAELARRLVRSPYSDLHLCGFFDDRDIGRLRNAGHDYPLLGRIDDVAAHAKANHVHLIYISLPMATQPRILRLLDDLRDTTASIYFVPDLFITDMIQSRTESVCEMPVVSVCETPFTGINGLIKRGEDIVLGTLILLLISPLLLALAIGVKLSSPGPVIFKQRRYGLDGQEIVVYKFRSMTVCEDGDRIVQASQGDRRITRLGAILRKTSLDELPQFVNVLQGRMSIVGPRPHAVAHNEQYRKLIKGYMVRHKVKPGISGWAQINGLRGETETLDKMKARIDFDLDYLRNWSLGLDIYIILKTVAVVFRDRHAY
ncbi:MAG: undecaprenyl-phosphate glucose phosphotransferase [Dechloromonas sp.]|nr:MAG: undecaprenyl-phosphate glucose phosphotransferase [Dechloromonas sp.]